MTATGGVRGAWPSAAGGGTRLLVRHTGPDRRPDRPQDSAPGLRRRTAARYMRR